MSSLSVAEQPVPESLATAPAVVWLVLFWE
ncbi:glycerol-3-phosphate dehydrogenase, anaerobic, A subunit, partial [Yersinia pestis PY-11]